MRQFIYLVILLLLVSGVGSSCSTLSKVEATISRFNYSLDIEVDSLIEEGLIAIMDVKSGYTKSIKFNSYNKMPECPTLTKGLELGSLFRVANIAVLLDDGSITLESRFDRERGDAQIGLARVRDAHAISDDEITLKEAFLKNSNVVMAKSVYSTFKDRDSIYIRKIEGLGLDIEYEQYRYRTPTELYLPYNGMGYGFEIAPLNYMEFVSAIANGGEMVGHRLSASDSSVVKVKDILSKENVSKMQKLMAESGEAIGFSDNIAAINGVAQIGPNYNENGLLQISVGYFPADNPQYTLMVCLKCKRSYSYTIAKEIFDKIAGTL